jgi:DNA-binding MarR family transcriptional regulator
MLKVPTQGRPKGDIMANAATRAAPHTAPKASADTAAWEHVQNLYADIERQLAQAMQRRHGIGLSEYRALEQLSQAPDSERRMQELADSIGLGQSSVTRLVGRLETAGFATKDLCPADKRGVYAVISDAGRRRYREARATYAETLTAALDAAAENPQLAATVTALRSAG